MPEIVAVHGQVDIVDDLPTPEFEGRLFYVVDDGLFRDNGVDEWIKVATLQTGMTNPMTANLEMIYGGEFPAGGPTPVLGTGYPGLVPTGYPGLNGNPPTQITMGIVTHHAPLWDPNRWGWSNINGSGVTTVSQQGAEGFHRGDDGTNWVRARTRGLTGNDRTVTMAFVPMLLRQDKVAAGLYIFDSSQAYWGMVVAWNDTDEQWEVQVRHHTSTIGDPTIEDSFPIEHSCPMWFQHFTDDGLTYVMRYSFDGRAWLPLGSYDISGEVPDPVSNGLGVHFPTALVPSGARIGGVIVHYMDEA